MRLFPDLRHRRLQPELMDQPDLDSGSHFAALRGLERINRWSRSVQILWPAIAALARQTPRMIRILDIASGAGDLPIGIWRNAQQAGLDVHIDAWDVSARAVSYARSRIEASESSICCMQKNATVEDIPQDYDVIMSSLFLHHLSEELAVGLLERMGQAARQLLLINDLLRSLPGLLLAQIATRVLTASSVVRVDGPRSVEGAFSLEEIAALAARAGLVGAVIGKRWPARFLLVWRKP